MTLVRGHAGGNFRYSVIMPSKGLLNNPGENNCFMNSAVQVLWHLDVFRRSFRLLYGHTCLQECCIFCALQEIFEKFQASDEAALPPDVLRIAMAKAFQDQHKFQLGRMDDAAECFENILRRLHFHIACKEPEDMCNAKHCIPHQKFAMQMLEQTSCKCGATSEPLNFYQIVTYVSASALIKRASESSQEDFRPRRSFGKILKVLLNTGERRPCPDDRCIYVKRGAAPTKVYRTLLNSPDIVGIGIIWDTDRPSSEYIMNLLDCLGKTLEIKHIFDNVSDEKAKKMKLRLVGIMTYYGKHYTTFFYNTRRKSWFYFDDAKVKEIGDDWELVKSKCKRGRFQPLLVLYANPDGEPIATENAPKRVKILKKQNLQGIEHIFGFHLHDQDLREQMKHEENELSMNVFQNQKTPRPSPVKRKSFKKLVGSAFKKRKSFKPNAMKKRDHCKYSTDHGDKILSINGHDFEGIAMNDTVTTADETRDGALENNFTDYGNDSYDMQKYSTKQPLHGSNNIVEDDSSPLNGTLIAKDDAQTSFVRYDDKQASQSDKLYQHQRHLESLNSVFSGEPLNNDEIQSRTSNRGSSLDSDRYAAMPVFSDDQQQRRTDPTGLTRQISNTRQNCISSERHEMKDHFALMMDVADSLLVSSKAAEQEGNLVEAFHLCIEANRRYRDATDIEGLDDNMKQYADEQRWDAHDQSRILSKRIDAIRSRRSVFHRSVSKTSDYGSYTDTSCSPVTPSIIDNQQRPLQYSLSSVETPNESSTNQTRMLPENWLKSDAKLATDRKYSLGSIVEQPRYIQDSPSLSEMEQLSALLKDFDVNDPIATRRIIGEENEKYRDRKVATNASKMEVDRARILNDQRTSKDDLDSERRSIQCREDGHPTAITSKTELRIIVTKLLNNGKVNSDIVSDSGCAIQHPNLLKSRDSPVTVPKIVTCSVLENVADQPINSSKAEKTQNLIAMNGNQFENFGKTAFSFECRSRNASYEDTGSKDLNEIQRQTKPEVKEKASRCQISKGSKESSSPSFIATEAEEINADMKRGICKHQAGCLRRDCDNDRDDNYSIAQLHQRIDNPDVTTSGIETRKVSNESKDPILSNITTTALNVSTFPSPSAENLNSFENPSASFGRNGNINSPRNLYLAKKMNKRSASPGNLGDSTWKLCEQCGKGTVKGPRKYCDGCQSEYL